MAILINFNMCIDIESLETEKEGQSLVFLKKRKWKNVSKNKTRILRHSFKVEDILPEYSNCPIRYV